MQSVSSRKWRIKSSARTQTQTWVTWHVARDWRRNATVKIAHLAPYRSVTSLFDVGREVRAVYTRHGTRDTWGRAHVSRTNECFLAVCLCTG